MKALIYVSFLGLTTVANATMMKDTYFQVYEGGMARFMGKVSAEAAKADAKGALMEACTLLHDKKTCKKNLVTKILSLETHDYPRYKGTKEEIWKVSEVHMEGSLKNSPFIQNILSSFTLTPGKTECTSEDYWYGGYKKEGFLAIFTWNYEVEFGMVAVNEKGDTHPGSDWTVTSSHNIYKHWRTFHPARSSKRFNDPAEFAAACEDLKQAQEKAFEAEVEKNIEAINKKSTFFGTVPMAFLIMTGKLY